MMTMMMTMCAAGAKGISALQPGSHHVPRWQGATFVGRLVCKAHSLGEEWWSLTCKIKHGPYGAQIMRIMRT
eukprot:6320364-Karenia_brevis.AAC.1